MRAVCVACFMWCMSVGVSGDDVQVDSLEFVLCSIADGCLFSAAAYFCWRLICLLLDGSQWLRL